MNEDEGNIPFANEAQEKRFNEAYKIWSELTEIELKGINFKTIRSAIILAEEDRNDETSLSFFMQAFTYATKKALSNFKFKLIQK